MKSIEEAAREQAAIKVRTDREYIQAKQDFKAGVEFAQQWISVKDELPERDSNPSSNHQSDIVLSDIVLLKNKFGNIFSGYYDYDMASFFNYIDDEVFEIIEWRPIELNTQKLK